MTTPGQLGDIRRTDVQLRWRASPLALAIATCAAVSLAASMVGSRWSLIAFAAPLLGMLVSSSWQRRPAHVQVHAQPDHQRCFESEQVQLSVSAVADSPDAAVSLDVTADPGTHVASIDQHPNHSEVTVSAERWGRYPIRTRVDVVAPGGLLMGTATIDSAEVIVFPLAPPETTPLPRTDLLDRIGTHLTRRVGSGVEYANIRPYVPGDHLRTINWRVSARRGNLHVTQRLSERAADVVVLIDTYPQPSGPATTATERTARGAVQVVQSALRNGDRAGIVTLGGHRPRWLGADIGRQQFYRVLDAVLSAGDGYESTTRTLTPRAAVPPGAIVVAFSTMLDTDFALALIDLCKRGHVVVAVDVLDGAPFNDDRDPLFARMWMLQRSFMYRDMRTIGVDVLPWTNDNTLDQAMHLMPNERRRAPAGRR